MNDTAYFYAVFYIVKQHCSKSIHSILDIPGPTGRNAHGLFDINIYLCACILLCSTMTFSDNIRKQ